MYVKSLKRKFFNKNYKNDISNFVDYTIIISTSIKLASDSVPCLT